jgi:hypothetical protein
MDTPYGDIPDRLARDMRPQEQHEYLQLSYGRRRLLKGAAGLGAAAVAGPVLWRQPGAAAAAGHGPQWIAFGADPAAEMYVSWSGGASPDGGSIAGPRAPQVRWGTGSSEGSRQDASASRVPVPAVTGEPAEQVVYSRTLLTGLLPKTTYRYSVSNDGVRWSPDATFTTGHHDGGGFRFTAFGDEATSMARAYPMARLVAAQRPAFHLVAGDLAYATSNGIRLPGLTGFSSSRWDDYLKIVGPAAAQSIPWQAAVGAHRRAAYCCLSVDVTAATATARASMQIRALRPAQTLAAVTSIATPVAMDTVTLIRRPAPGSPIRHPAPSSLPWMLGGAGAAATAGGAAAYVIRRRGPASRYHADGTGPAEVTDDRTDRKLAEPRGDMPGQGPGAEPGRPHGFRPMTASQDRAAAQSRGEVVQYPSTDRCFALQVAAPFLMQAAPGRSVPSPEPPRGQRRAATRSRISRIPIYQGTR